MQEPVAYEEAAPADPIRTFATHIDAASTHRSPPDPLRAQDVWQGILAGEWKLLVVFENAGRTLMVGRRRSEGHAAPLLSCREIHVLAFRARAYGVKLIAFELQMSQATVSRTLTIGLRKLGLHAPTDLVRFAGPTPESSTVSGTHRVIPQSIPTIEQLQLTLPPGSRASFFETDERYVVLSFPSSEELAPTLSESLSQAEREVLLSLVSGSSPSEIAKARRTSQSTVNNQLQSLYKKLHVGSRLELRAYLSGVNTTAWRRA
jgi:DNA-binding NarL/FixJ family response regulator